MIICKDRLVIRKDPKSLTKNFAIMNCKHYCHIEILLPIH